VVAEGYDKDAMKDPSTLRHMEQFSGSSNGTRRSATASRWSTSFGPSTWCSTSGTALGVIPESWVDIGGLFFIYFSGSPPTETAKYVDPSYTTAHVTFFCKDHKGENIRRIIRNSKNFMSDTQLRDLGITIGGELEQPPVVTAVAAEPVWEKAGPSWVVGSVKGGDAPFKNGDRIVKVGKREVKTHAEFRQALTERAGVSSLLDFTVDRNGTAVVETVSAPWKAVFKLAGG